MAMPLLCYKKEVQRSGFYQNQNLMIIIMEAQDEKVF